MDERLIKWKEKQVRRLVAARLRVFYAELRLAHDPEPLIALWPLRIAAYRVFERLRPEERSIVVDLREGTKATQLIEALERAHARIEHFQLEDEPDRRIVTLTLDTPSEKLLTELADLEFVQGVEWRR